MPSPPSVSALGDHLGFWLRTVSNHVSQAFAARLAERDVTVAEWVMLRSLHGRDPLPPSRLAADMGMTRGAITKLADRLIAKQLVTREADTRDGRAQTLALTERGTRLVPGLAAIADRNDAAFFAPLADTERETLRALLMRMVAHGGMTGTPTD